MRLTLSLILIAAVALYGASFLQAAQSGALAEAGAHPVRDGAPRSICIGCGGPVVPFDPSGGVQAGQAPDAARKLRPAVGPPASGGAPHRPGRAP